jgi:hypothetical protein
MLTENQMRDMDDAAEEAKDELLALIDEWTVRDVATWWARWYLQAGHKRLGRTLVELSRKCEAEQR